ncbi:methyltransferase domain-containing protein [Francisella sp. 19X1-34]|uniref:methyltransferase domain-containing protein n=1 Tax=Francisella sp. 19X1-34 TaxID=3087177 RepID=UPI002E2EADD4|nr:methyltransferase domain-containing protein [Francisella sp. 19X1-34]MED7789091.1 methyltransferase domain-containing protein [Francisella sp. 19X1-34]
MNFNKVAKDYKNISITQNDASKRLLDLIGVDHKYKSVLDVGCASGVNTDVLLSMMSDKGRYLGIDPSKKMIELAQDKYSANSEFICSTFENFNAKDKFDFIFCNSVFYFFKNKQIFFEKCNDLLSHNGYIAIQAQTRLCGLFSEAIDNTKLCESTKEQMKGFDFPANLVSEKEFLKILYEQKYFSVKVFNYHIDYHTVTIDKAMDIFRSGPAIPCLSEKAYKTIPTEEFKKSFLSEIRKYLENKSDNGVVTLDSPRVYIVLARETSL